MSTLAKTTGVVYVGHAPEVAAAGHTFPNGVTVQVSEDLAKRLLQSDAFTTPTKGKGD